MEKHRNQKDSEPTGDDDGEEKETNINADEVKDRQTTHWDMDYLTTDQIETAYEKGRKKKDVQ